MAYALMFSPYAQENHKRLIDKNDPTSYIPTYIAISPRKDGITAKTKCLNPQYNASALTPLKRKLLVSSTNILPKFRVRRGSFNRRPSSVYAGSNSSRSNSLDISKTSFVSLPVEILSSILFYLDYTSVQKLARTCKHMYSVCHDDGLWRKLLLADFQSVAPPPSTPASTSLYKKTSRKNNKALVTPSTSSTNLKLYQNHLKLGRRWLTGKVDTRFLQGHSDSIYCLSWIDQDTLVSGSRDKTLKVWNVKTNQCTRTVENEHDGSILCMRVNKDRSLLLTGSSDATCTIWSLPDLAPIRKLRGHGHSVLDVCFVHGNRIVTASRDHTLRLWNQDTGEEILHMLGHTNSVNAVETVDEHRVVSASGDATLKLWDVATGECIRTLQGHRLGLACVRYDGKHLYSGGLEGKIKVWDVESGKCINTLLGHVGMIRSLDCIHGRIVTGSYDRTLKVWDTKTGACILSFQSGHSNWIFNVLSSGTRIVSSGQEKRIMVLDFSSGLAPLCAV
ncbi:uncharacterized protein ATC70_003784 [Mucor velutinosus]|uniref:F-box domain-containing protein n=1 Tax=Mucor velutinosus TaxID=708070 RepID=A0AAN7DC72_9FUNG|nr:hypothetical protein ATC70_003784 [Mucor velutinosus]